MDYPFFCGTINSHMLKSSDLNSNRLLIQNDSLNYWAWIKSSGFFHYHPETGFIGENGEVWISGNRNTQRLEEQNLLESKMLAIDSLIKEQSTTNENSKIKEQSQKSKSRNTIWWYIGIGFFIFILFTLKGIFRKVL